MNSTHDRPLRGAVFGALLVVACGSGPSQGTGTSSGGTSTAETQPTTSNASAPDMPPPEPCRSVRAIFFDLGDTLVVSDGGNMFVERPGAGAMIGELKALGMLVSMAESEWLGCRDSR